MLSVFSSMTIFGASINFLLAFQKAQFSHDHQTGVTNVDASSLMLLRSFTVVRDHDHQTFLLSGRVALMKLCLAYIYFGPIDPISVQLQSKTDHFPGGF